MTLGVRKLGLLCVKVAGLSVLWLCSVLERSRVAQRGQHGPCAGAEGTKRDNVLNSHIKQKKSWCLLVPQGMVSTDLPV